LFIYNFFYWEEYVVNVLLLDGMSYPNLDYEELKFEVYFLIVIAQEILNI